jgi:hypothetical protein
VKKIKSVQILSNGSANFSYKSFQNLNYYIFFEKDYVNFSLNSKLLINIIDDNNIKKSNNFKHRYIKNSKQNF